MISRVSACLGWMAFLCMLMQMQARASVFLEETRVVQPAAAQLFVLGNEARANVGASQLLWDPALAAAALRHCLRMAQEGSIGHRYEGEPDLTERAGVAGAHFSLIEENVAVGSYVDTIHEGWMHSTGHRENLLNPEVDRVGIAVVASQGMLFAVADFARGVAVLTPDQVESAVAALIRHRGVPVHRDAADARRTCAMEEGVSASADPRPRFILRWQSADLTHLPQELIDRLRSGMYRGATVGACSADDKRERFTSYRVAVLLY
jgi:hypothetical protein